MTNLPERWEGARRVATSRRALEQTMRTEAAIYEHHLVARFEAECDRIDSEAVGSAVRAALESEMESLSFGLERAEGSPAKAELVARLVGVQSKIDGRRIARRFGGR